MTTVNYEMRTIRTTQTLKEVVRCLKTHVERSQYSIDLTMTTDTQITTLRDICIQSFAKKDEAELEICRLFAIIELLLKNHSCKRSVEEDARSLPCKLDYHSGVCEYLYYNHILEVSIMKENVNDTEAYYYYVVISFPEQVHLYEIVEIPNDWVPKFTTLNHVQINDEVNIRFIAVIIAKVFDTFCKQFVIKKEFRRREYSMSAIEPMFSVPEKSTKTKKRKTNTTKFQVEVHPIYDRLDKLFKAMEEKPNENARLFALIHDILVSIYSCKISTEKGSWPGGAAYDGHVYDLLYSETKVNEMIPIQEQYIEWHAFKLCLLTNEKEFYICVRFSANTAKKCIKRITKSLVPTFDAADINKENEKIYNLASWLSAIIEHFIRKVIAGSYHSSNASFISSVQESEDEGN